MSFRHVDGHKIYLHLSYHTYTYHCVGSLKCSFSIVNHIKRRKINSSWQSSGNEHKTSCTFNFIIVKFLIARINAPITINFCWIKILNVAQFQPYNSNHQQNHMNSWTWQEVFYFRPRKRNLMYDRFAHSERREKTMLKSIATKEFGMQQELTGGYIPKIPDKNVGIKLRGCAKNSQNSWYVWKNAPFFSLNAKLKGK